MSKNKKATEYSMLWLLQACKRFPNPRSSQEKCPKTPSKQTIPKRKGKKQTRTEETPSILQDLLNLDKQPPITGPARDRMQEIDASVPKLQAIQAYTSPRNELAAEIARAIFHFESVRM